MARTVTITGGSGFVGQLLRRGLAAEGHEIRVFDPYRGILVDLLRRRRLAHAGSRPGRYAARVIRAGQVQAEAGLRRTRLIRRGPDDICSDREALAARFRGSDSVIHLAGIPHPHWPGATEEDFVRLNYDAAVNVFEAARDAGVPVFVFASSAQVYLINRPVRIDGFPILETNHCPTRAEGQTAYGFFKREVERYLEEACAAGGTKAVALRLECPGVRSRTASNFYVSTSVENTVAAFARAIEADLPGGFGAFNVADAEVDPAIADVQLFLRERWPHVPNYTKGNEGLLGTEKARRILGYAPVRGGTYHDLAVLW